MDAYTEMFGDRFAEEIGRSLLAYFESKEFPKKLLKDPTIDLLYLKAQVDKVLSDRSLSDVERCALIGAAIDTYYEMGGKPLPFSERLLRHKFSAPGVEK